MNRRNKRIISYFILLSFILVIGIVFAVLQANLQINGTAKIAENEWDVHFDNIVVNPDSVSIGTGDTAATIDPNNNCKVDFSVTLSIPGDFYEYTVDVENEGTIDAMIGTLTKSLKVNNVEVETVPEYLNYFVTYEDGTEILENHLLAKNTSETYKIRLEYRTDIDNLPTGSPIITTSVEPVFIQADSNSIEVHPVDHGVYVVSREMLQIGNTIPNTVNVRATPEEVLADWSDITNSDNNYFPFYTRHVLNENDEIVESYIGFLINDQLKQVWKEVNCITGYPDQDAECEESIDNMVNGSYYIKGGDNGASYEDNVNTLKRAFNYSSHPEFCDVYEGGFGCYNQLVFLSISASTNGQVDAATGGFHCNLYVDSDAYSNCDYQ